MIMLLKRMLLSFLTVIASVYISYGQYCEATAENGNYEYISSVTIDDTTINSGSDLYADYTDIIIDMYKGEDYLLEFVNSNHDTPDKVACWVDWNQNEEFEADERVELEYDPTLGEPSTATGTVIPPSDALAGTTRMRIMLADEEPSPCLTFMYGEVEDYSINVKEITEAPEVDFEADQTHIYTDEEVQFTDLTFLDPHSWEWSFEPSAVTFTEGTDANSQNPVVRFEEPGSYDVTLIATNDIGTADTTFQEYINVNTFNPPRNVSAESEGAHVNLSWDKPNMPGYFDYEILDNADALIGATPERATLYDQEDFDFTYPITIKKIRASFYEDYENNPWSDATFYFKIYGEDGSEVLYESPEIEAVSFQDMEHELNEPLTLEENFYLAVVPVDTSGAPQSLSRVVNPGETHSYFLYEGEWVQLQDTDNAFELVNGIYISGEKDDSHEISYSSQVKPKKSKSELEDFELSGYNIYRNSTLVKEIDDPDSTFWIDDQLDNGHYQYYMTASYAPQGESTPSDTVEVTVDNTEPEIQVLKDGEQLFIDDIYSLDTNVIIGQHADMEFAIYNEGMNDLEIGEFTIDHEDFSLMDAPASTVAGQDTTYFTIRFDPSSDSVSLKQANISFETNDSNEDPFEFSIEAIAGQDKWTWMVYLLEDGTGLNGAKDINEWEVNGSVPGRANYIVLYDAQDDDYDGVYYVEKDPDGMNNEIVSTKLTDKFGIDPDMSDPETLRSFMFWVQEHYPAQQYGLTMWDHGSGIFKGDTETKGITRGFVDDMKLWEMSEVVEDFHSETGQKIDVIGFDVCLLGQFETAYQFRNTADYVIASESYEPGDGWDYIAAFDTLTSNPDMDSRALAKNISETFVKSYKQGGSQGENLSTQAVTSNIVMKDVFLPVFDSLSNKLSYYLYDLKTEIESARNNAWATADVHGGGEKNPDHRDLGGFLQNLMENVKYPDHLVATIQNALDAYNEMIVHSDFTGSVNEGATGVKIWMPKQISNESYLKDYYLNPESYLHISYTQWDEYLEMFEEPSYNTAPEVDFVIADTTDKGKTVSPANRTFFAAEGCEWNVTPDKVEFVNGTDKYSCNPEMKFTETGDFTISLTAENEYGSADTTKENVIYIKTPSFNAPENLTAQTDSNIVKLSWQAEIEGAIFEEGFENLEYWPPEGWAIMSNDNLEGENLSEVEEDENTWGLCDTSTFTDQDGNPDPQYIHSGNYSTAINYAAGSEGDPFNWLITPEIELRENEQLTFWLWYASDDSYYTDFDVMIYADDEWTSLLHLTEGSGINLYDEPIKLSLADYDNKTVKIAFVYQYTDGYQLAIDDISINNAEEKNVEDRYDRHDNYSPARTKAKFVDAVSSSGKKYFKSEGGEGYNIYRNKDNIATVDDLAQMNYTDTIAENGEYSYYVTKTYTNPEGESESSNEVTVTIDLFEETAINDEIDYNTSIYPNPSNGWFVIDFNDIMDEAEVKIYNSSGSQVYNNTFQSVNRQKIILNNISKGVYMIEIKTNKGSMSRQIVIQ